VQLTFGVGSKLWMWTTSVTTLHIKLNSDDHEEEEELISTVDPAGTVHAHTEISPHAVMEGATDPRRFGFYGRGSEAES
jgi:hypothetical protein